MIDDDERAKEMIARYKASPVFTATTPEQVASQLKERGIRGDYTPACSPIAAYLRELGAPMAYAFPHYVDDKRKKRPGLGMLQGNDNGRTWSFKLPQAVDEFLARFHRGEFREIYGQAGGKKP